MVPAVLLSLLTFGFVCGQADAEKTLVYVTVVSNFSIWQNAAEVDLYSLAAVGLYGR